MESVSRTLRTSRRMTRLVLVCAALLIPFALVFTPAYAVSQGHGRLEVGSFELVAEQGWVQTKPLPMATPESSGSSRYTACSANASDSNSFIPIVRWTKDGAINTYHSMPPDGIFDKLGNAIDFATASMSTTPAMVGNTLWSAAAQFTQFTIDFCPAVQFGPIIDRTAGDIGKALWNSGLGALFFIVSFITVMWSLVRAASRGALMYAAKRLIAPVIFAVVLVLSFNAASHSTSDGKTFAPGTFSPGWMIVETANLTSSVVETPLSGLNKYLSHNSVSPGEGDKEAFLGGSCHESEIFRDEGSGNTVDSISQLWEPAALRAYIDAQFGSPTNKIGQDKYCWLLDWKSGSFATDNLDKNKNEYALRDKTNKLGFLTMAGPGPKFQWTAANSNDQQKYDNASVLGWLVCEPKNTFSAWEVTGGTINLEKLFGTKSITPNTCAQWWSSDTPPTELLWDNGDSGGAARGTLGSENTNPDVAEALIAISSAPKIDYGTAFAFLISGLVAIIVFGAIDVVILVAKLAVVVMALFIIFALFQGMLVGQMGKVKRFGQKLFGLILLTMVAQLLITFIIALALILNTVGGSFFTSPFINALWGAASPLVAVATLHFGSKNLIGTSPFTAKGVRSLASADPSGIGKGVSLFGGAAASFFGNTLADRFGRGKSGGGRNYRHKADPDTSSKNARAGEGKTDSQGSFVQGKKGEASTTSGPTTGQPDHGFTLGSTETTGISGRKKGDPGLASAMASGGKKWGSAMASDDGTRLDKIIDAPFVGAGALAGAGAYGAKHVASKALSGSKNAVDNWKQNISDRVIMTGSKLHRFKKANADEKMRTLASGEKIIGKKTVSGAKTGAATVWRNRGTIAAGVLATGALAAVGGLPGVALALAGASIYGKYKSGVGARDIAKKLLGASENSHARHGRLLERLSDNQTREEMMERDRKKLERAQKAYDAREQKARRSANAQEKLIRLGERPDETNNLHRRGMWARAWEMTEQIDQRQSDYFSDGIPVGEAPADESAYPPYDPYEPTDSHDGSESLQGNIAASGVDGSRIDEPVSRSEGADRGHTEQSQHESISATNVGQSSPNLGVSGNAAESHISETGTRVSTDTPERAQVPSVDAPPAPQKPVEAKPDPKHRAEVRTQEVRPQPQAAPAGRQNASYAQVRRRAQVKTEHSSPLGEQETAPPAPVESPTGKVIPAAKPGGEGRGQ